MCEIFESRDEKMLQSKAYTEAYYIVSKMPDEMRSKIPDKIVNNIKSRMDKNYKFYIPNDDFENAVLLDDTEQILSVLYTDYLSTDEERKVILYKEKMLEEEKRKQFEVNVPKLRIINKFGYEN